MKLSNRILAATLVILLASAIGIGAAPAATRDRDQVGNKNSSQQASRCLKVPKTACNANDKEKPGDRITSQLLLQGW